MHLGTIATAKMIEKHSSEQLRRSLRLSETEKPDDKTGCSAPTEHNTAAEQLDGQSDNRESSLPSSKQTYGIKQGRTTAQSAKKKANGGGSISATEKTKQATNTKIRRQSRGGTQPQEVVKLAPSKKHPGYSSPGLSTIASSRSSDQASLSVHVGSHKLHDKVHEYNKHGGFLQVADGGLTSFGAHRSCPNLDFDPTSPRVPVNHPGQSSQFGDSNQPTAAMYTPEKAQYGHQSSNHVLSSIPGPFLAPMNSGQWGRWYFDNRMPIIALPSYSRLLPYDQFVNMGRAASSAHGLIYGWLSADWYRLNSQMEKLTDQQAQDLIEATKKAHLGISVDPQFNPSNDQAGTTGSEAWTPNARRDAIFYQAAMPEDIACTTPANEDEASSEASDESFDISRYSLQTADGGQWYDPKFELAGLYPFGNRLVAGVNCPPNVLQLCDLKSNWYGEPARFIPYMPSFRRRSPQKESMVGTANVGGQQRNVRSETGGSSSQKDLDPSQQRVDPHFFTRLGTFMGQSSQVRVPQSREHDTCDSHECQNELGREYITCARCHQARYCSKFCQAFTWLVHLPTCHLHPEANADKVTALEEWATELWNGAAKVVKNAEEGNAHDPMDAANEDPCANIFEPHTRESSVSTSPTTSDDAVMGDEEAEDQQAGTEVTIGSQSPDMKDRHGMEGSKEMA